MKLSSNSRTNGPIAQDALLSLALLSSSALRPSKSRRFTSLPSVAPRISPRLFTTSTTSGSGLFQLESERTPILAPQPTLASGAVLVKISASGPIATSRYCDHRPSVDQRFLEPRCIVACPGRPSGSRRRSAASSLLADLRGAPEVAARAFLDHSLDRRDCEGDARSLDRLQVDRREETLDLESCKPVDPEQSYAADACRIGMVHQVGDGRGGPRYVLDRAVSNEDRSWSLVEQQPAREQRLRGSRQATSRP